MNDLTALMALVGRGLAASKDTASPFAVLWVMLRQIVGLLLMPRHSTGRARGQVDVLVAEAEDRLARTLFERALIAAGRTDIDPANYDCRLVWRGARFSLRVTPRNAAALPAFSTPVSPLDSEAERIRRRCAWTRFRNWRFRARLPSRYTRKEQITRRFEQLSRRRPAHRKTLRRLPPRLGCAVLAPP